MQLSAEELTAIKREMVSLLRLQMENLESAQGLTDEKLAECYARQSRIQELREKLQEVLNSGLSSGEEIQPVSNAA